MDTDELHGYLCSSAFICGKNASGLRLVPFVRFVFISPRQNFQTGVRKFQTTVRDFQTTVRKFQTPVRKFLRAVRVFQTPVREVQTPVRKVLTAVRRLQTTVRRFQTTVGNSPTPSGNLWRRRPRLHWAAVILAAGAMVSYSDFRWAATIAWMITSRFLSNHSMVASLTPR